jgi:hypothetical protein
MYGRWPLSVAELKQGAEAAQVTIDEERLRGAIFSVESDRLVIRQGDNILFEASPPRY